MTPREFAIEVTRKLQQAGYQALFAGGCVRDALLNRKPKDYDVATSARPEQVRELFGKKRTIAIGAAFGVITVLGPKAAGQIEIATFRRDGDYGDGRRPDSIQYTDAREDALRRDFTINGMFFDPVNEEVIDYVNGREDLKLRRIRAIGDPHERIEEDKLRMLRAVRFAATYEFELEPETLDAVKKRAAEIDVVSPERIGNELRRTLSGPNCGTGLRLLTESGLWEEVFPVSQGTELYDTGEVLQRLELKDFETVVAALLPGRDASLAIETGAGKSESKRLIACVDQLKEAWRLTNDECDAAVWICENVQKLRRANELAWPDVQPALIQKHVVRALALVDAIEPENDGSAFCRERLDWAPEKLNPLPLLDGKDLIDAGIQPGPLFKKALTDLRREQLEGRIESREDALQWAMRMLKR